jgi:hypothetical protein
MNLDRRGINEPQKKTELKHQVPAEEKLNEIGDDT